MAGSLSSIVFDLFSGHVSTMRASSAPVAVMIWRAVSVRPVDDLAGDVARVSGFIFLWRR